jgi:hypothetical protein
MSSMLVSQGQAARCRSIIWRPYVVHTRRYCQSIHLCARPRGRILPRLCPVARERSVPRWLRP